MKPGAYRIILLIMAILIVCPVVSAEKLAGDESNSIFSFTELTYSNYYQYGYGYSPAYPPQDLGQYSDPISAINAYNKYNLQNRDEFTTYATLSPISYQYQYEYITPQKNYQLTTTEKTIWDHGTELDRYIISQHYNQNDVTMRTSQEIQNPEQYQYIAPTSPNLHCYKASPDAVEVCSYS